MRARASAQGARVFEITGPVARGHRPRVWPGGGCRVCTAVCDVRVYAGRGAAPKADPLRRALTKIVEMGAPFSSPLKSHGAIPKSTRTTDLSPMSHPRMHPHHLVTPSPGHAGGYRDELALVFVRGFVRLPQLRLELGNLGECVLEAIVLERESK